MTAANDCETIRIDNLSIGYPGKNTPHFVAKGIHSSLYSGELTCLLGANGAGKSTLLRTLSVSQSALEGNIYLQGRDILKYTRPELATLISVVLTDRCEVEGMTVYELIALGRTPYTDFWGKLDEKDEQIVQHAISLVGIEQLSHRRLSTLSDGERQKAMIAKALAQETPVILLDEPTAFLDFPSKVEIMQLLRRLSHETNKSILLSTHDLELALQIADKIWLMEREKELITGTPEDLALDGRLTHFFQRDGVSFNTHTGLFGVNHPVSCHINMTGNGERYEMALKALRRNGIKAENGDNNPITINIDNHSFAIANQGKVIATVDSVDLLLKKLKEIV